MTFRCGPVGFAAIVVSIGLAGSAKAQEIGHTATALQAWADCAGRLAAEDGTRKLDADVVNTIDSTLAKVATPLFHLSCLYFKRFFSICRPRRDRSKCDGSTTVYVESVSQSLLVLMEGAAAQKNGSAKGPTRTVSALPYARASVFLGGWEVEQHDYQKAVDTLRRGLLLAPTEPHLTSGNRQRSQPDRRTN